MTGQAPLLVSDEESSRSQILVAVTDSPGIHKADLCDATGLSWGTVGYHLRRLEKESAIRLTSYLNRTVAFPMDIPYRLRPKLAAIHDSSARRVLSTLATLNRPASTPKIASVAGLTTKVARRCIERLLEAGFLHKSANGPQGFQVKRDEYAKVAPFREMPLVDCDAP